MPIVLTDVMGVAPNEIPGVDEPAARRIISIARSVAPCIDSLEGEAKLNAIAILQGVAQAYGDPTARRIKTQSRNGTSVTYTDVESVFSTDDRSALRALCPSSAAAGMPRGSFPVSSAYGRIWPEGAYT